MVQAIIKKEKSEIYHATVGTVDEWKREVTFVSKLLKKEY